MNQFDFNGKSFDKIAGIYEDVRPGYGSGVYTAVAAEKKFGRSSELLEIGCGTGIATKEIADFWGAGITALEPGENLIAAAKKNLCKYKNIKFVNKRFEDFESDSLFDGIFCATAFHWLDPDVKYEKAASLLKDDGILAVYWNNFGIQDTEMQIAIDNLYAEYNTLVYDKPIAEIQKEKVRQRMDEITHSGYFTIKDHRLFTNIYEYDSDSYIKLLQTFSDHSKEKMPNIEKLFEAIRSLILAHNNRIVESVVVNLEIAEKI